MGDRCMWAWCSGFIRVQGVDPGFHRFSLLVNLKCKSEDVKHGKRKNNYPKWSVIEISQGLK